MDCKGRVTVAHDGMIDRLDFGLGYGEHGLSRHSLFFYLLILTMSLIHSVASFLAGVGLSDGRARHSAACCSPVASAWCFLFLVCGGDLGALYNMYL